MHGIDEQETKKKSSHVSADDLADGFILDKDDRRLLSYKVRFEMSTFSQFSNEGRKTSLEVTSGELWSNFLLKAESAMKSPGCSRLYPVLSWKSPGTETDLCGQPDCPYCQKVSLCISLNLSCFCCFSFFHHVLKWRPLVCLFSDLPCRNWKACLVPGWTSVDSSASPQNEGSPAPWWSWWLSADLAEVYKYLSCIWRPKNWMLCSIWL